MLQAAMQEGLLPLGLQAPDFGVEVGAPQVRPILETDGRLGGLQRGGRLDLGGRVVWVTQ